MRHRSHSPPDSASSQPGQRFTPRNAALPALEPEPRHLRSPSSVGYNDAMTKLLEKALAEVSGLPAEDQDAIAADILAKVVAKNARSAHSNSLSAEPFFGMWRDRTLDSVAWTREIRKREWSH